ncbi:hypothetical protein NMY22_g14910 [Coprinellus aureogranulatus]|nr:hypothetical protein NMY22_g14910 [Coprinellus aureogranulatus]
MKSKPTPPSFLLSVLRQAMRVQCGQAITLNLPGYASSDSTYWVLERRTPRKDYVCMSMVIKATPEQASGTTELPIVLTSWTSLLCKTEASLGSLIHEPSLSHLTLMIMSSLPHGPTPSAVFDLPLSFLRPAFYLTTELPIPILSEGRSAITLFLCDSGCAVIRSATTSPEQGL